MASEASEPIATKLVEGIRETALQYCDFPLSAPAREQLGKNMRVAFHKNYAVYFTPSKTELIVVRVIHAARDVKAIATGEGFG